MFIYDFTNTEATLEEYGKQIVARYRDHLLDSDRVATSSLLGSLQYEVKVGDRTLSIGLNLAEYWKYVEWDTRPHWPPKGSLVKWIEVKPVIPQPGKDGRIPSVTQLDFLIRRKIAREGTTGSHDLAQTLEELNGVWRTKIALALCKDLGGMTHAMITETFKR